MVGSASTMLCLRDSDLRISALTLTQIQRRQNPDDEQGPNRGKKGKLMQTSHQSSHYQGLALALALALARSISSVPPLHLRRWIDAPTWTSFENVDDFLCHPGAAHSCPAGAMWNLRVDWVLLLSIASLAQLSHSLSITYPTNRTDWARGEVLRVDWTSSRCARRPFVPTLPRTAFHRLNTC